MKIKELKNIVKNIDNSFNDCEIIVRLTDKDGFGIGTDCFDLNIDFNNDTLFCIDAYEEEGYEEFKEIPMFQWKDTKQLAKEIKREEKYFNIF